MDPLDTLVETAVVAVQRSPREVAVEVRADVRAALTGDALEVGVFQLLFVDEHRHVGAGEAVETPRMVEMEV